MQDENFLEVIAAEVAHDPQNAALREDFITLLLQHDVDRAAEEVSAFEAQGGDSARVSVLRARLMAARLRGNSAAPPELVEPDLRSAPALWEAERPTVTLSDVAGLADVKQHLDSTFLGPLRNPELAAAFGQKPGGSLLMYGPPGCGKTFIARAIAGDLGASFIHVTLADLLSKYIGDTEKAIRSVFRDARAAGTCVIFFDEFDALGARRSSGGVSQWMRMAVTQLLEELDGVSSNNDGVYFLAATNRPWDIDPALRRPGRIDKTVLVLPPDAVARAAIMQRGLESKPADDVDVTAVAAATEGFSGADIAQVVTIALQQSAPAHML